MKREVFCSCFYIVISSLTYSDISQNNAEILEKQWRHEEQQQILLQLEEVARLCQTECMAQKARRKAEEKAWKEAERVVEEEERKKRTMEYFQPL